MAWASILTTMDVGANAKDCTRSMAQAVAALVLVEVKPSRVRDLAQELCIFFDRTQILGGAKTIE